MGRFRITCTAHAPNIEIIRDFIRDIYGEAMDCEVEDLEFENAQLISDSATQLQYNFECETCAKCPFVRIERCPDAGYAHDYFCKISGKRTMNYIEYPSELEPVPEDCPLRVKEDK